MAEIYEGIASKIRGLRLGRPGLSQEKLAEAIGTTPNTISRWETATYRPSVGDLDKLARFFDVPITVFFPTMGPDVKMQALLSATGDLDEDDFDEILKYAQFRRARRELKNSRAKP